MNTFKIVYIEYNELKSTTVEADNIISALEEFRMETHIDKDQIISAKQVV